jgi:hypothetical protein
MSSRALRRAQRELEEKQVQQQLDQEEQEDESEEEVAKQANVKPSVFALLGDDGDDEVEDADDDAEQQESDAKPHIESAPSSKTRKSKKKKKKGKAKQATAEVEKASTPTGATSGLDEIDQALLTLSLTASGRKDAHDSAADSTMNEEMIQLFSVLSVDSQHLHATNEMRKLFGRAALQNTDDEPRQRQRGHAQPGGIAAAIAGRNAPGARGLAALGLRRNIFVQGKEEWPRATSGGLGMEIVEKRTDGSIEYRFVHNRTYQEVQHQFHVCVASMDPERMIQLLHLNRK